MSQNPSTRQDLFRRLTLLGGQVLPKANDPSNQIFTQAAANLPVSDNPNTLATNVNTAFESLLASLSGIVPQQIGGPDSIGSPQESLEEVLNQAAQVLTLATPASPVIRQLLGALKAKPINVDLKRGPTGLSVSLPNDLSAIKDAALRIARAEPPGKQGGQPGHHKQVVAAALTPSISGSGVYAATAMQFSTTLSVTGGTAPYQLTVASSSNLNNVPGVGLGATVLPTGDPTQFMLVSSYLPGNPPFLALELTVTDHLGNSNNQLVIVDWTTWLAATQAEIELDGQPPAITPGGVAGLMVEEVDLIARNLPSQFTLVLKGPTPNVQPSASAPPPVWIQTNSKLRVWVDLSFLAGVANPNFVLEAHDVSGKTLCSCTIPVEQLSGPTYTVEEVVQPADPLLPGGSFSVFGSGLSDDAFITVYPAV